MKTPILSSPTEETLSISPNSKLFHKLTLAEVIRFRDLKFKPAETYLYCYIKTADPFGHGFRFLPKQIGKDLNYHPQTVTRAMNTLKAAGELSLAFIEAHVKVVSVAVESVAQVISKLGTVSPPCTEEGDNSNISTPEVSISTPVVLETIIEPVVTPTVLEPIIEAVFTPVVLETIIEPILASVLETIIEPIPTPTVLEPIIEPVLTPTVETILTSVVPEPIIELSEPLSPTPKPPSSNRGQGFSSVASVLEHLNIPNTPVKDPHSAIKTPQWYALVESELTQLSIKLADVLHALKKYPVEAIEAALAYTHRQKWAKAKAGVFVKFLKRWTPDVVVEESVGKPTVKSTTPPRDSILQREFPQTAHGLAAENNPIDEDSYYYLNRLFQAELIYRLHYNTVDNFYGVAISIKDYPYLTPWWDAIPILKVLYPNFV